MTIMEIEEIEAVLEKLWDLHDKLSDAIHSISQSHFLPARKARTQPPANNFDFSTNINNKTKAEDMSNGKNNQNGFVFMKEYEPVNDVESAVQEAKSLNSIRTALEHLEDQLEFFHTIQTQQRAERDAAIARLEQSRLVLAMRLADHHGKKHDLINEAKAFVGDVCEVSRFISPENLYGPPPGDSTDNIVANQVKQFNIFKILWSKVNFIKRSFKLDQMGGVVGNAALVALSMLLLVHVQQAGPKDTYRLNKLLVQEDIFKRNQTASPHEDSSPSVSSTHLDVLLARG